MPSEIAFQSTLPTRGSDDAVTYTPQTLTVVSIHAPHEGERRYATPTATPTTPGFNPRSPRGGATRTEFFYKFIKSCFNPRSPRGGAT